MAVVEVEAAHSNIVAEEEVLLKPADTEELPWADILAKLEVAGTLAVALPIVVVPAAVHLRLDCINKKAITLKWWN